MAKRKSIRGKIRLTGLAKKGADGQYRITRSKDFVLYNGSAQVHKRMEDRVLEFLKRAEKKGLSPEDISRGECRQILTEMGMKIDHCSSLIPK
ncbi:MAG: hypothetical protein ACYTFY_08010 [Planctomycetota bacterium]|jgi:hypothetical protein